MHTYVKPKGEPVWTVGFCNPKGEWLPLADYDSEVEAQCLVNYLNGGSGNLFIPPTNVDVVTDIAH